MQVELLDTEVYLHGEKIRIVEWAEKYFSLQIDEKIYRKLTDKVQNSKDEIESFIFAEKNNFYPVYEPKMKTKILEVNVHAKSSLYDFLLKHKINLKAQRKK